MARCDQGYLCDVCGEEVEEIQESDLYLRFVLGDVALDDLPNADERHLLCNPVVAQFIVEEGFPTPVVTGPFAKAELDPAFVVEESARISQAYRRLLEIAAMPEPLPLTAYPLKTLNEP